MGLSMTVCMSVTFFLVGVLWCLALSGFTPLALPSLFWTPLGLYHFRLDHLDFRRICTALRCFSAHATTPLLGTKPPLGYPQIMSQRRRTPNQDYLTPGALLPRSFPRMLALLRPGTQQMLLHRLCPMGCLSPDLATRPGYPCASTILVATFVQE
jgi:hypothetical protein